MMKVFYFRNRGEMKDFLGMLRKKFLSDKGEFIYISEDKKMLVFYSGEIEGGFEAHTIMSFDEVVELLKNFNFNTFAVRSKRENSLRDNKILGAMIKERLGKIVDLEKPDVTVVLDRIDNYTIFYIK